MPLGCKIPAAPKAFSLFEEGKKDDDQPPLQVHHNKGQHDGHLTGARQLGHDSIQTVTTLNLAEFTFNGIALDLILSGLIPGYFVLTGICRSLFRWSTC